MARDDNTHDSRARIMRLVHASVEGSPAVQECVTCTAGGLAIMPPLRYLFANLFAESGRGWCAGVTSPRHTRDVRRVFPRSLNRPGAWSYNETEEGNAIHKMHREL